MQVEKTKLDGVLKITPPTLFEDFRGSYVELYNEKLYRDSGLEMKFVQDDFSLSTRHVLRGLHGDRETYKLISCPIGTIYLVTVNLHANHPQYRQWEAFTLSETSRIQILVPPGFGLGHLVLSERAIFHYKQSTYYNRAAQFTRLWNDPELGIWWPVQSPILSRRDSGLEPDPA